MSDSIKDYLDLKRRIDEETKRLTGLYGPDITCRAGCVHCCINLTVFPVEYFAILREMKEAHFHPRQILFSEETSCGFLKVGLCQIYPYRPIICRTHGLPILFIDDSGEDPHWEVSFCERNFSNRTDVEFDDDMLLDIEAINAELNRINGDFIATFRDSSYDGTTRIPLKRLCAGE